MIEHGLRRDQGLIRGIGTTALAATVVNGVIGAGIYTLPAAVALEAGVFAPAAYLITALIMAGVVICFAEAGSRVPTSGGAYGTVEAALGPACGFVAGTLLLVSDVLASGGVAAALADLAGAAWSPLAGAAPRAALIAAVFVLVAAANLIGVRRTARLITWATGIKLIPLLLFMALGLATIANPPLHPSLQGSPTAPISLRGFGRALILTLFAFSGMETSLTASGEVRAPNRTLPRALFSAMLFILAVYLGVQVSAQHLLGGDLAHTPAPLAAAAGRIAAPARLFMLAAAGVSMLAWLANDVLGTSRMLFAFGRDGRLPTWFGVLSPTSHVPARAVITYAAAAALLAMTGSFLELIVLSALGSVGIYILACIAALLLRRRDVATAGPPVRVAGLALAALVGLVGMGGMVLAASWAEEAGFAGTVATSLLIYPLARSRTGSPTGTPGS